MSYDKNTPEPHRIFVVGCSRSGTSLVQRILCSNSELYSLPETTFFAKAIGRTKEKQFLAPAVLYRKRTDRAIQELEDLTGASCRRPFSLLGLSRSKAVTRQMTDVLDSAARAAGKNGWVEKTPLHFRYTRTISRLVPNCQIVHVIRDGKAVVGSILDRAARFPSSFSSQANIEVPLALWNEAIHAAHKDLHRKNAWVIVYEDLVMQPQSVTKSLCDAIGIRYNPEMLEENGATQNIVKESEKWKSGLPEAIAPAASKFDSMVPEDLRSQVIDRLELGLYQDLKTASRRGLSR